ncbi:CubicO group peptidase, beta-lactamase class C family [Geodermatophilus saharensis]|uniref:CubicO group peptidase, beta-lactamase class C family n=1 Tax=Geodermatophilus saharensis TaxID=1137994 RepID=A0A239CWX4_9ACTN|nr:serine hydrolase domain-containing protein [Geodermatophilus saharensis]SNS23853.1 CubicO group peptidase, beta-lactamase class C family [Geodermatophilus saharensis]
MVVAVLLAGACTAGPPTPAPATATDTGQRAARSDALLREVLAADEPGCSAAVGIDGEVVWAGARGAADLRTGRPLTTGTTFDVGSVSKQFTATAVLLLEQDGVLTLQDPVSRWVPGLPGWGGAVTLDHLVHHTSGIPDYLSDFAAAGIEPGERTTQQQALETIASHAATVRPPGTSFDYSNSNYVLLAEVVRNASGEPLPAFLRARVFEPLGLDAVVDPAGADPDATDPSSARGHVRDSSSGAWRPAGSRFLQVGDGSVQTTPSELVRWADVYRTGRLGGQDLLDAQLDDPAVVAGGYGYAAGINVHPDGALEHSGSWAGFLAWFAVSADRHTALAVSCNGDEPGTSDLDRLVRGLHGVWS